MDFLLASCLFSTALSLVLGLWVLLRAPQKEINRAWFFLNITIAIWVFGIGMVLVSPSKIEALFWIKFRYFGLLFAPLSFMHFVLLLVKQYHVHRPKYIFLSFLAAAILVFTFFTRQIIAGVVESQTLNYNLLRGQFYYMTLIFFGAVALFTAYILIRAYFSSSGIRRNQIKYVMLAMLVGYASALTMYLPVYGFVNYPFGVMLFPVYQFIILYAMAVTRLMDMDLAVKKSLVYSTVAAMVMVGSVGVLFSLNRFFKILGWNSYAAIVVVAFLIAVSFQTINQKIRDFIDRRLFNSRFRYQQAIKESTQIILRLVDLDRLLKIVARLICRRMGLKGLALFIYDEERKCFYVKAADRSGKKFYSTCVNVDNSLVEWFKTKGRPVIREELQMEIEYNPMNKLERQNIMQVKQQLEQLDAEVCLPAILRTKLLGFLALSEKVSGGLFNNEELDLLYVLADHIAIAIENAQFLEKQKELIRKSSEIEARAKYAQVVSEINRELAKTNTELVATKEEIIKKEKMASLTQLAVALNHEIGNPLTAVMANLQLLVERAHERSLLSRELLEKSLGIAEKEMLRIRDLIHNLQGITEPVVADLLPGVPMIDLKRSFEKER